MVNFRAEFKLKVFDSKLGRCSLLPGLRLASNDFRVATGSSASSIVKPFPEAIFLLSFGVLSRPPLSRQLRTERRAWV